VSAQSSADVNAANNPLQPTLGANMQNYYVSSLYGIEDASSNSLLLRGTMPHKLFGRPQLLRLTIPVATSPDLPPDGRQTGLGDLNIFDTFLFKAGKLEVGIGPQLTIPTATHDETGTGKWQAGLAVPVVAPQTWGIVGTLVTWQTSFAGDDDRRRQNNLQFQPLVIRNFSKGWYARSTALWTWDLEQDTYYIPLGLGVGKVWAAASKKTVNVFAEPQWTVAHKGDGVPKFQLFAGLNLQFPLVR
jgi:hypothetical protein